MKNKLNRDGILQGILQTLVDGWGRSAVLAALDDLDLSHSKERKKSNSADEAEPKDAAQKLVESLSLPATRKRLLVELARDFDLGLSFPKLSDARSFLISYQANRKEIKNRTQAFRLMVPVLLKMSEKGLEKVLSKSYDSGPADLASISEAIRGAGEDLRGRDISQRVAESSLDGKYHVETARISTAKGNPERR